MSSKNADHIDDENLMKLHLAQKFEQTALSRAKSRINEKHGKGVAENLMMSGRFHGDPISATEAKAMAINVVEKGFPKEAYDLTDAKLKMLELNVAELARLQLGLQKGAEGGKIVLSLVLNQTASMTMARGAATNGCWVNFIVAKWDEGFSLHLGPRGGCLRHLGQQKKWANLSAERNSGGVT